MEDYSRLHGDDEPVQYRLEQISQQTSADVSNLEEDENASKDESEYLPRLSSRIPQPCPHDGQRPSRPRQHPFDQVLNTAIETKVADNARDRISQRRPVLVASPHDGDGAVESLRETTGGDKMSNKATKRKKGFHKVIEDHLLEFVAHEPTHSFTNIGDAARQCQPIMTIVDLEGKSEKEIEDLVSQTEAISSATAIGTDINRVDISEIHEEGEGKNTDHAMVLGDVGAGKTVTSKKYALAVSKGEVKSLQHIEVVHVIKASDLQTEAKSNAFDLLFTQQVGSKLTPELQQEGKEWMANNAHKTLIVVDGLDQATEQFDKNYGKMTENTKAKPTAVLSNVLSGDIYPGLKILSTAQWRVYWSMKKKQKPSKTIALRGFTEEKMEEVIRKLCDTKEAENIINFLRIKAPQLLSLCKNPMFLIYTVHVLKQTPSNLTDTFSGIMASVLRIFSASMHSDADIDVLMKLAHHGMKDNRFTFTSAYVDKLGIPRDQLRGLISVGAVLIPFQDQIDKDDIRFQYSHRSLQELLAAVHLFNLNQDQFNEHVRSVLSKSELKIVLRLLYGIVFNPRTTKAVEKYIKDRNCDIESCKETLMQQLRSLIVNGKIKEKKVISLIHEAGPAIVANLQPEVNKIAIKKPVYKPEWGHVILSVINNFSTWERVYLENLEVTSSLIPLLNESIDKVKNFEVVYLTFSGEMSLSQCKNLGKFFKITSRITFNACKLTSDKLQRIRTNIAKKMRAKSSLSLCIENDPSVDSSCMPHIVDIMAKTGTEKLEFRRCRINKEKIDALRVKLEQAKYKITSLAVYEKEFKPTRGDVCSICRILLQVTFDIWLNGWEITEADISVLQNALDCGSSPKLSIYVIYQGKPKMLRKGVGKPSYETGKLEQEPKICAIDEDNIGKSSFEARKVKEKPDVCLSTKNEKIPDSSPDQQLTDASEKLVKAANSAKRIEDQSSVIEYSEGSSKLNVTRKDQDVSIITKNDEVIVSKTTRLEIGSDGGVITVGDCVVTFPKNSLQSKTEIVAKAEINRAKWPKGYFLITPMLYVDGGGNLSEPASVRMISWCINKKSKENENATVNLLHCDDESDEWNPISKLPFTNETVYQFECTNFSPYAIGIAEDDIETQTFLLQPFLFSNPQNTFAYTFSVTDKMVLEAIKKDMRELGFSLSLIFTTPSAQEHDKICVRLQCASPDGFFCVPTETPFKIDSEMAKMHRYITYFIVKSDKHKTTKIHLESSILKNGVAIANNQPFFYNWKSESEAQSSQGCTPIVTTEEPTQRLLQQPPTSQIMGAASPVKVVVPVNFHLGDNLLKGNAIETMVTGQSKLSSTSYDGKKIVASNSTIEVGQISNTRRQSGNLRRPPSRIPQPCSRDSRRPPRQRSAREDHDQASNMAIGTNVTGNARATVSQHGGQTIVASGCNIGRSQRLKTRYSRGEKSSSSSSEND